MARRTKGDAPFSTVRPAVRPAVAARAAVRRAGRARGRLATIGLVAGLALAWSTAAAAAPVPELVSYAGLLTFETGSAYDGNVDLTFALYDAAEGGVLLWGPESHPGIVVNGGVFGVMLGTAGTSMAPALASGADRWLEITVGEAAPLTPRQRFTSVPFALRAGDSGRLGGVDAAEYALATDLAAVLADVQALVESPWDETDGIVSTTADAVGIGTADPQARLDVAGSVRIGADGGACTAARAGTFRFDNKPQVCDGNEWRTLAFVNAVAQGGSVTNVVDGGVQYRVHTYTQAGSHTFDMVICGADACPVEYLVVGGGGGGGSDNAGGGGGGGVLMGTRTLTAGQSYAVTVGAGGGHSGTNNANNQTAGGSSSFYDVVALGGGEGANGQSGARLATVGASGGGGDGERPTQGASGTPGQGHPGGDGGPPPSGADAAGGGGGGAGGPGQHGAVTVAGQGGPGLPSSISGTQVYYGGGGGGGGGPNGNVGASGGIGGGGAGGPTGGQGGDGAPNTGGGGGGSSSTATRGGNGGSGIVIIRYPIN